MSTPFRHVLTPEDVARIRRDAAAVVGRDVSTLSPDEIEMIDAARVLTVQAIRGADAEREEAVS